MLLTIHRSITMKKVQELNLLKTILILFSFLIFNHSICQTSKRPLASLELESQQKVIEEIHLPAHLTRVDDKMVLASYKTDKLLFVYSLPEFKFLGSTGRQGRGPDEIPRFAMFCKSENESLYVWGYTLKTLREFDISKEGELILDEIIDLRHYKEYNYMHIVSDSIFIYFLIDQLKIVKSDLTSGQDIDYIELDKDDHKESFYYKNRGIIAANDSFLVYGYIYKKQIDIYRVDDFKLHKQIIGKYKKQDPVIGGKNNSRYYTQIVAGKKYFYALYKDIKTGRPIIEVYDYNGSFQKELILDISPEMFIVDETENSIYGYALNSDLEPCFMRFEF